MQFKQVGSLSRTKQAGFTLIELIVVIVILGILAATALPRFADMGDDARVAKMAAARGSVLSAMSISHGEWLVRGTAPATVTLEGATIDMTNGYPAASATGIVAAAGLSGDYKITHASGVTTVEETNKSSCQFTYTQATATAAPVVSAAPALTAC